MQFLSFSSFALFRSLDRGFSSRYENEQRPYNVPVDIDEQWAGTERRHSEFCLASHSTRDLCDAQFFLLFVFSFFSLSFFGAVCISVHCESVVSDQTTFFCGKMCTPFSQLKRMVKEKKLFSSVVGSVHLHSNDNCCLRFRFFFSRFRFISSSVFRKMHILNANCVYKTKDRTVVESFSFIFLLSLLFCLVKSFVVAFETLQWRKDAKCWR